MFCEDFNIRETYQLNNEKFVWHGLRDIAYQAEQWLSKDDYN